MHSRKEIQEWLVLKIAQLLQIDTGAIDVRETFSAYGLSSLDSVMLSGELEEYLGRPLSPTLAYDYPSIAALSDYLVGETVNKSLPQGTTSPSAGSPEPIAIIGMSCRFPGADNLDAFWELLKNGVDAITEVPKDRWNKDAFYHPDPAVPGKSVSRWGGFLDNIDQFDPFFFGISPVEAKHMDPQQRLLMELSYEALDDAGQVIDNLQESKTGVFIGISVNEYSQLSFSNTEQVSGHSGTGNALSVAANRISYFYNFHGPSLAVDTACSSSLAAVHLACQSLRQGECTMALAGGVNMILSPAHSIAFTKAGVLAPDGRCKPFDSRADGYVRGEGGGVIVLKPLSAALADGDPVQALIVGSAMMQDGRTNGLMAPNGQAQEGLLREAYRSAGVSPACIRYVDAHGTGTILGDAMEAQALGAVIGAHRTTEPCLIGSVKSNLGHLEAAAGMAGLIKVVLGLRHQAIPPSIHYHTPNPHINFDRLHLSVNDKLKPWPAAAPRLAGVNSFGFGGTNVHLIIRDADDVLTEKDSSNFAHRNEYLLPLAAPNAEQLRLLAADVDKLLVADLSVSVQDICRAAAARRSQQHCRLVVIGSTREEFCYRLRAFLSGGRDPRLFTCDGVTDTLPGIAFVFPGQGGQWIGMGREIFVQEPVFRVSIEQIDKLIQSHFSWSLIDVLFAEDAEACLEEIDVIQPVLFALQIALATLLQSWGIRPGAVVGHSMGEIAAAHVAGILSLEEAVQIVCRRSRLLKPLREKGRMLATELSHSEAAELLQGFKDDVSIAVINSSFSTVLSGNGETIKNIKALLEHQNRFCKLVNVNVASHSPQMEELRADLLQALAGLNPQAPTVSIYSTVTGNRCDELSFTADYWMDNLRKPVLFSDTTAQMLQDGYRTFIEIGPHPVLLGSIQQSAQATNQHVRLLPTLRRHEPQRRTMLEALATLYTEGRSVNWKMLFPEGGKHVRLPVVRWQRQRYWMDAPATASMNGWHSTEQYHPLLGVRMNLATSPASFVWQTSLDKTDLNFLSDHRVGNDIIFPAAGYIEMALQCGKEAGLNDAYVLCDFVFSERMKLDKGRTVQTHLSAGEDDRFVFSVYSQASGKEAWVLHASANFLLKQPSDDIHEQAEINFDDVCQQSTRQYTAQEFYNRLQTHGLHYGPAFQAVEQVWGENDKALGLVRLPEAMLYESKRYRIHPALLDACLQVVATAKEPGAEPMFYLPAGCKRIQFYAEPASLLWSQVSLTTSAASEKDNLLADLTLWNEKREKLAELIGLRLQRISRHLQKRPASPNTWWYQLQWRPKPLQDTQPVCSGAGRQWLILTDNEGFGEELAKTIEEGGGHCHLWHSKEMFRKGKSASHESFIASIEKSLNGISSPLSGIIHLWSLSAQKRSSASPENADETSYFACESTLALVQALANLMTGMPRLWFVTKGAQPVKDGEPVTVEQSALWGLGKVISFELPEFACTRIDLDPLQSANDSAKLLFQEIFGNDPENQIAYRAGLRFVQRLSPFPQNAPLPSLTVKFSADGTYLITGGLGGLGLKTAEWMVQRGAQRLVLLSKSEPSQAAMRVVEQLRQQGAEVVIAKGDVSDPIQVNRLLDDIKLRMPVMRGVIHAAGILDDSALLNLTEERMRKVMAPKVAGTWNLHEATSGLPLDFFVLFSSAVSVLGSPGQGNYAAASAYLDAFAHYRRSLGLPATSINWGPWADVGLAAEAKEKLDGRNASTEHLIKVIQIEEGLEVLGQLLRVAVPQIMVLPFDLKNLIALYPTAAGSPFLAEVGGSDTHVAHLYARPNLRQPYVAPNSELERKLVQLWQQTLHIDRVGVHDSFFELGGDSVLAAQVLSSAQKLFGIRIDPQEAFQAFTIKRLAELLEAHLFQKIEDMSEEEVRQLLAEGGPYAE